MRKDKRMNNALALWKQNDVVIFLLRLQIENIAGLFASPISHFCITARNGDIIRDISSAILDDVI